MNELRAILADFTPGAAGVWTGVLMFAGWMLREWREDRKLSAGDKLARREGYEKQVQMLSAENREVGKDLRELRAEYDRYRALCQSETDGLRLQIIELQRRLAGLDRKTATQAIDLAHIAVPGVWLEAMAHEIDDQNEENSGK